jgi:hypothetical protein
VKPVATKLQLGALTPTELADRVRNHPGTDRVELDGITWRAYPRDRSARPVFWSAARMGSGTQLPNVLRDLRRSGMDIERPPATTPAPTTQEEPVASPRDMPRTPTTIPTGPAVTKELAELRDMVRRASDRAEAAEKSALEFGVEAERRISQLGDRIARLEDQLAGGRKPPTITELTRAAVHRWFRDHPGMRLTPQILELNAGDDLPAGRGKTTVAGVCADLVRAGLLSGGAASGQPDSRGVYWFDPAANGGAEPEPQG